jgi:zeta-carotene desaturase
MTLIEPGGRRSVLAPSSLPAPMHGLPAILRSRCFTLRDKLSLIYAFTLIMAGGVFGFKPDPNRSLNDWLESHLQTRGALDRFWRLVIASALNADLDQIGLPYAVKVIRELFLNSPQAGSMGMSRIPLSDLYEGAQRYLEARHGGIQYNSNVEAAVWNAERSCGPCEPRVGKSVRKC